MRSIVPARAVLAVVLASLVAGCGAASTPTAAPTAAPTASSSPVTPVATGKATPTQASASASPTTRAAAGASPVLPTPGTATGAFPTGRFAASPVQPVDLMPNGDAYIAEHYATALDHYTVTGDQVSFQGESCGGVVGTYQWSLSAGQLDLKKLADPCLDRLGRLVLPLAPASNQLPYVVITHNSSPLDQPDFGLSAVAPDGTFWETDGASGLYHYAADGSVLGSWTSFTYATGVAVDTAGHVYVANFDDATIHVLDQGGTELTHWQVDGGKVGPVGIAVDHAGNLYVALHRIHDHYIEKYSPAGTLLASLVPRGSGPGEAFGGANTGPGSVVVDGTGNIWLDDPVDSRLVEVDARGRPLRTLTGAGDGIMAVDAAGDLYTMDQRVLSEFSPAGKPMGAWFAPYDANVLIDSVGDLFLVDQHITAISLPRG